MAKQPPSASKNKDDDSWGKLASDLLGIQFGGADDDFDLPDDEPPAAKSIPAEVTPPSVATPELKGRVAEQAPEPDLSFPEEDLSFPEDDDVSAPAKKAVAAERRPERREVAAEQGSDDEPAREREPAKRAREDGDRDIWDALESWNFDEPHKPPVARSQSDASAARGGSRPIRADGGPRRDRDGGRERPRDRDQETPRREAPPRDQAPRSEQSPRERPPREEVSARPPMARRDEAAPVDAVPAQGGSDRGPRRRSESRGDAPRAERGDAPRAERGDAPRSGQRPPQKAPAQEARPPRSLPPESISVGADDGFASGLDDEPKPRRSPAPSVRSEVPVRKPTPAVRQSESVDDDDVFASDLFQEFVEEDDSEEDDGGATSSSEESSDEDRPRPRRRRRRRGGRGRRTEAEIAADGDPESSDSDDDNEDMLGFGSDDDSQSEEEEAADSRSVSSDDDDDDENNEDGEKRRPRRRRRRGRKRSDDQPAPVAASVGGDSTGEEDDDDDDVVEDAGSSGGGRPVRAAVAPVDEEPLAPVNYEGIPTWEEAISYLIRSRGPDPRGRGNSGPRGRGGAHQRR